MTDGISFISIRKKIKKEGKESFLSMSIRLVKLFQGIGFCDFTRKDYGSTYIIVNNMTRSQNAHIKAEYEKQCQTMNVVENGKKQKYVGMYRQDEIAQKWTEKTKIIEDEMKAVYYLLHSIYQL